MSEFDVELNDGFDYQHSGDLKTAQWITISAYTMRQMDTVAPIKEVVMKCFSKLANDHKEEMLEKSSDESEDKEDKEDKKEHMKNGKEMMALFYMYCDKGDMVKFLLHMKKLLSSKICSIDGEVAFKTDHIEKMTPADFEKLCGEYVGNFIAS